MLTVEYIETSLVPATGRALAVNLVICSVLQFIALGLAIAVLWGKIRGKEVWIVKKKDTARGTLWLPNSGLLWTVVSRLLWMSHHLKPKSIVLHILLRRCTTGSVVTISVVGPHIPT